MKKYIPRIMFSAPKSGEGKTTVVCGILQALVNRKMSVSSFKCGPDYIDTLFHREIIGTKSSNLDLFFTDENMTKYLLWKNAQNTEISVIEGAMGYYDGLGGVTEKASAYHTACATNTPVVLVLDGKGSSLSLCAAINGFKNFREKSNIVGVILNKCSNMQLKAMKETIEKECNVEVLGCLSQNKEYALESRHLGLVTAAEVKNLNEKLQLLAEEAEKNINIDRIIEIAKSADVVDFEEITINKVTDKSPVIAVARDKAFCFYYNENLEVLEKMGAEIKYFSPLKDSKLPENTAGIYIGGGYPEVYLKELSENIEIKEEIKKAVQNVMPILAECGGFMYITESIEGRKMASILNGRCENTGKLGRFGYITLTALNDNILCSKGESIRGHEFHYYDCTKNGESFIAQKPVGKRSWNCIYTDKNIFAGYPHLYFLSNLKFAENFVKKCALYNLENETEV